MRVLGGPGESLSFKEDLDSFITSLTAAADYDTFLKVGTAEIQKIPQLRSSSPL